MLRKSIFLLLLIGLSSSVFGIDDARLLRYPDINGTKIVFVYAGDIWSVSSSGGDAKRLTSHEGLELFPKLSPDGKWIAFSAEYSGSRQIWVMPAEGGTARQLTYYNSVGIMPPRGGYDNVVLDWTADSRQVLVRANRTPFGDRNGRYYLVSIDGGLEKPLQIINGGFAALSNDGTQLCFTPVDREFRTWKRYKGGRATELWTYNLKDNTSEQITSFAGSDQWPTWFGEDIYFASDRDLKLNIYKYNVKSKATSQVTFYKDYDVMWPSGKNGQLVYENGGYLYRLDVATGKSDKVVVNISFDNTNLIPYYKNVAADVHSYAPSPSGKRVLFDARGDIFSVPAENGPVENLTSTRGVREVYPSWSPNGKLIAYSSDATGEYELYVVENKKGAVAKQLTSGSKAWKYASVWSPNSKFIAYSDRTLNLLLVDAQTGKQMVVDHAERSEISSYSFSPDSQWLTYTKEAANGQPTVWVYHIPTSKATQLLGATFANVQPSFSRCGKFLFFVSNRDFNLSFSSFEFNYVYNNASRVYAVALRNDGTRLLKVKNDVEGSADEKKEAAKDEVVSVAIDFEGVDGRVMALPMDAGDYDLVGSVDGGVLFIAKGKLQRYSIAEEKVEDIMDDVAEVVPTADGKSFMYKAKKDYGIAKVAPNQKVGAGKLDLSKLELKINPREEWDQIYTDAWRIFRDYFYVSNLHGVDWTGVKKQYGALLPYVASRFDLDYLLNEMVSEANVGHAYVDWGDIKRVKRVDTGLLGADLVADEAVGRYKIAKIYKGENWNPERRSPLTEQGVDVKEGDYLISINGKEVTLKVNPYELLENLANVNVDIAVSATGSPSDTRTSSVKTIDSELELLHYNWVCERREMVDKLSGGRVGYIYLPNTAFEGNRELHRGMYANSEKDAMIFDDRYNGGGFIPDRMIEMIERRTLAYWYRNGLKPMATPGVAHDGPKVMLINGYSSSGGDALPYFFRKMGQGPLIGTRTWGGLVGLSGNARLVDGGFLSVPQFGIFNEKGEWIVEGVGVSPDIEVVDRPEQLAKGEDPCIAKAVELLLKELNDKPARKIVLPAAPDRSGWIEKDAK